MINKNSYPKFSMLLSVYNRDNIDFLNECIDPSDNTNPPALTLLNLLNLSVNALKTNSTVEPNIPGTKNIVIKV